MSALLRAELIKLRTTRTFIALTPSRSGTSLLIAVLVTSSTEPTEESVLTDVFTSDTSGLFILILGVIGITGEWRHHTITSSLLASPDRPVPRRQDDRVRRRRPRALARDLARDRVVGWRSSSPATCRPRSRRPPHQFARNAMVAALLGAFGVGLGALVRNQVVAIVGLLVLSFVVEPTLIGLAADVGRYGRSARCRRRRRASRPRTRACRPHLPLPTVAGVLLLLAWIGAAFATGAALLKRAT